jgi:hypothetical protein
MPSEAQKKILVIGGTGAQGAPVVKGTFTHPFKAAFSNDHF